MRSIPTTTRRPTHPLPPRATARQPRRLASLAVLALLLAPACVGQVGDADPGASQSDLGGGGSGGVTIGFGGTTNHYDGLHLTDGPFGTPDAAGTVAHYLHQLHSGVVHVRVPWCRLEPAPGDFSDDNLARVRTWVEHALAGGQDAVVSLDTWAPYFARRDAMKRDHRGHLFDGRGCGRPDGAYPDGAAAPELSSSALWHFGATVGVLLSCLRGDATGPAACRGTNLLPHVGLEIGSETNWFGSWQNGRCASGKEWYRTGLDSKGRTCLGGNGPVARIHRADADFYGEMVNTAARVAHRVYDFHPVAMGGVFMHGGHWNSNHVDGLAYFERIYDRVANPHFHHSSGRLWDAVGPHLGGRHLGPRSVLATIDAMRSVLRRKEPDAHKPIWTTGLFDREADPQAQADRMRRTWKAIVDHYSCTAWHPVRLVIFSRLPDPTSGHLNDIGFMDGGDAAVTDPSSWRPKPLYDVMARALRRTSSCGGG